MKTVSRVSKYGVGKGDVQLEVLVGNGQLGASVVEGGDQEFEQVHDFKAVGTLELAISDSVFLSATAGQDAATETRPGGFLTLWGVSLQASQERKVSL